MSAISTIMMDDELLSETSNRTNDNTESFKPEPTMQVDNNRKIQPIKRCCRGRFYLLHHGKNYFLLRMPCCRLERWDIVVVFWQTLITTMGCHHTEKTLISFGIPCTQLARAAIFNDTVDFQEIELLRAAEVNLMISKLDSSVT